MSRKVPKYRRHPNGQAFVEHKSIGSSSRRLYLGTYGSTESHRKYEQFIARFNLEQEQLTIEFGSEYPTINELIAEYLLYCEQTYRNENGPSNEFSLIVQSLRPIARLYGDKIGAKFEPTDLVQVQNEFVRLGYLRKTVNSHIGRVKRMFRWCCKTGRLPAELFWKLQCVDGLRAGRTLAPESKPKSAIGLDDIQALDVFMSPVIRAMVWVQFLCGMRPQDVVNMRWIDVDRSNDVWLYRPQRHKNHWRGQTLVKAIPKLAQTYLEDFQDKEPEDNIFSPQDLQRWNLARKSLIAGSDRKTKAYPCEVKRCAAKRGDIDEIVGRYTKQFKTESYNRALKACFDRAEKAGVKLTRWTPNQLRHGIATTISTTLGREAAQAWLGHQNLDTTQIYVEKRVQDVIEVARRLDSGQVLSASELSPTDG